MRSIVVLCLFGSVVGCASAVKMDEAASNYSYKGEKYGKVVVTLSDDVTKDHRKESRSNELDLEQKIVTALKSEEIYDVASVRTVSVTINRIHVRNAFNAIAFGILAGTDNIDGTVRLLEDSRALADFNITASYGLGGFAGGLNSTRLGWLSEKFAELTAKTIVGKGDEN